MPIPASFSTQRANHYLEVIDRLIGTGAALIEELCTQTHASILDRVVTFDHISRAVGRSILLSHAIEDECRAPTGLANFPYDLFKDDPAIDD